MYLTDIKYRTEFEEFSLTIGHDWQPARRGDWNNPPDPPIVEKWSVESINELVAYPLGGDYGFKVDLIDDNYAGLLRDVDTRLHAYFENDIIDSVIENFDGNAAHAT